MGSYDLISMREDDLAAMRIEYKRACILLEGDELMHYVAPVCKILRDCRDSITSERAIFKLGQIVTILEPLIEAKSIVDRYETKEEALNNLKKGIVRPATGTV